MMMRNNSKILIVLFLLYGMTSLTAQERILRTEYLEQYAELAMIEMKRTGIPASITLAQGCLESDDGNSRLAVDGKNHFGIKCHDWTGKRIYHDDDEADECFRKYNSAKQSYIDHSDFLQTKSRYAELFELDPDDYKGWARGLKKAGYATSNMYADLLITIIEENELYLYDKQVLAGKRVRKKTTETVVAEVSTREAHQNNRISYIIIQAGDTPDLIREEFKLYPRELYRYNDISKNTNLEPGMLLYIEPKRFKAEKGIETHVFSDQESMWDISQIYGIRLQRLYRLNNLSYGKEPEPGTVLQLRQRKIADKGAKSRKPEKENEVPDLQLEFEEF
ncbi:glucosaminidase domain-containing protein [Bacteroidota bacterium]